MTPEQIKARIYDLSVEAEEINKRINESPDAKRYWVVNLEIASLRRQLQSQPVEVEVIAESNQS